jgi:hypothetical protein
MKEVKTHTLLQNDSQGRPNLVFSFQDWGDHYQVRVDGKEIFFDPVTGYQIFIKGEYSYCKFVFRHSGEVRKMHIDVAREIYTALLEQGFAKTDYSPHIEMVQDEFCARDDANSSQGYNYAINA